MKREEKEDDSFIARLSYNGDNLRQLGKSPISVPKDPFISSFIPFSGEKVNPEKFFYSLFFTAFDVRDYGGKIEKFIKIFTPLNLKKIYLETYRDGFLVDTNLILDTKKILEKKGFKVSGAVTTTHLSDKNQFNETSSPASCYTDKNAKKKLKEIFEFTAKIFDEIIIDDWYFTLCMCPDCKKAKEKQNWDEFRCKLLYNVAKKYIIEPAKKINEKVKLIIKFPQWYEDFHKSGYDLNRLIYIFDEVAVGTETRDYKVQRYMPVHGALLFKYIKNFIPEKVKKAWFDIYICDEKIFSEQAYQSVLGGAEEIILFCAGVLPQKNNRAIVENLVKNTPKIERLSGFSKIFSIPILRKANTEGDYKLHQYFLMIGIPAYLTDNVNFKGKIVILTAQSESKKNYKKLFFELISNKKNIVMTLNFAKEIKKYFKIKSFENSIKIETVNYNKKEVEVKDNIFINEEIINGKSVALFNNAYNFISFFKIRESIIWVINFPFTTDTIITPAENKENADYRYLLHNKNMVGAIKDIFKNFANVNLYEKIKTLYRYEI